MPRTRIAALIALAVLAAPACARTTTGVGTPQASADPTTTPSSPSAPSVFPPEKIDTLLLNVDEVNNLIRPDTPFRSEDPIHSTPAAAPPPQGSPEPSQCWNARYLEDFAASRPGWKAFRSLAFVGKWNSNVEEGIILYPDHASAANAFTARVSGIKSCKGRISQKSSDAGFISFEVSIQDSTGDKLEWAMKLSPDSPADYVGSLEDFRVVDNALISVSGSDSVVSFNQLGKLSDSLSHKLRS